MPRCFVFVQYEAWYFRQKQRRYARNRKQSVFYSCGLGRAQKIVYPRSRAGFSWWEASAQLLRN